MAANGGRIIVFYSFKAKSKHQERRRQQQPINCLTMEEPDFITLVFKVFSESLSVGFLFEAKVSKIYPH